jgi:hypothetical protein
LIEELNMYGNNEVKDINNLTKLKILDIFSCVIKEKGFKDCLLIEELTMQ